MQNYFILAISIFAITGCSNKNKTTTPESFSDFAYESSDTEISEEAGMVDIATSLSDVDNCNKIEESTITYDSSMATAFADLMTAQTEKNMKRRLENMARIRGAELGADRVRLIGEYEASMVSNPTQRVAYYSCKK